MKRSHGLLLLAIGVSVGAAVGLRYALRSEPSSPPPPVAPPSVPSPAATELDSLADRAEAMVEQFEQTQEWRDTEFAELLAAAATFGQLPADALAAGSRLLQTLGYYVYYLETKGPVAAAAAQLATIHAEWRREHPPSLFSLATARAQCEACWRCADYVALSSAVAMAQHAHGADDREKAMVLALECRLHCVLGRLDAANLAATEALDAADRAADPAIHQYVALAVADLCLLNSNFELAGRTLRRLDERDPWRRFYEHLIAAIRNDPGAEARLLAGRLPPQPAIQRLVFAKLTQAALQRDDLAAAQQHLDRLQPMVAADSEDPEGRTATLALEVALRSGSATAELRERAVRATSSLLERWRVAPRLDGGTGFLQLDDRSTLLANLMRTEAALQPGPAGAALAWQHLLATHAAERREPPPADAESLLTRLLTPSHGFLAYVPGRFQTVLLVADHSGITLHPLAGMAVLRTAADELREAADLCRASADRELSPELLAKAADLFLPAEVRQRMRSWQRASICGASMLNGLAIELLPLSEPDSWLGANLAVDRIDDVIGAVAAAPARRTGGIVFAGALRATHAGAAAYDMPAAGVAACLAAYADDVPMVRLLDGKATRSAICRSCDGALVIHLVGHCKVDTRRPDRNGIAFSDDPEQGSLWGRDVSALDLRGAWVILGSCDAGTTPARRGGDPLATALAGAMRQRGARAVLVPTSPIEVHRHLAAMAKVHAAIARVPDLGAAMLQARRDPGLDRVARLELLLMQVHGPSW